MKRSLAALASIAMLVAACQTSASPSPQATLASPAATATATGAAASAPASAAAVSPPASAQPATPGQWITPPADVEPEYDIQVALTDGRVLALGNSVPETGPAVPLAQVWYPVGGDIAVATPLPSYRQQFTALALRDGKVLVTGGLNDKKQSYSSTYLYDPGSDSWTKSGLLNTARTDPAGAVLHDGRVLVVGGYFTNGKGPGDEMGSGMVPGSGEAILAAFHPSLADIDLPDYAAAMATAEIFDPSSGTWSETGPMTYARSAARAVTLADGRVLVFGSANPGGGIAVDPAAMTTAEVYDPATGRFTLTGPLPSIDRAGLEARGAPGANPIPDEEPYLASGRPVALRDGGAVVIGFTQSWKHVGDITRSFRYDPAANAWSEIGETWVWIGEPTRNVLYLEGVRNLALSASAALLDGRVLVAVGLGPTTEITQPDGTKAFGTEETDAALFYDPATNSWPSAARMPETVSGAQALMLADGSILVYGGSHCSPVEGSETECVPALSQRFVP